MARRVPVIVMLIPLLALSWLGMQALHEFGHVLHAWVSGGTVVRIVLQPLEISRTDVSPNPAPLFVAWGGFVWGSILPVIAALVALRWCRAAVFEAAFFAGFCLIANGGYLGAGCVLAVGDTRVLQSMGTPRTVFLAAGLPLAALGLYAWHRLDAAVPRGTVPVPATLRHTVRLSALLAVFILLEYALAPGNA